MQIIDIISKHLIEKLENTNYRNIFGRYSCSGRKWCCVQENRSKKCAREADINIIKQRMACVKLEVNCVKVIYDDTDVFVLLGVNVFRKVEKLMEAFGTSWSLIDINETAKKHAEILPLLTDARAPSGCDSLPKLYGTGKKTVIKHLKDQNLSLWSLGDNCSIIGKCLCQKHKIDSIILWYPEYE